MVETIKNLKINTQVLQFITKNQLTLIMFILKIGLGKNKM